MCVVLTVTFLLVALCTPDPPDEANCPPGHRTLWNINMYGTRNAATHWEDRYAGHLVSCGFVRSKSQPCVLYHPNRDIKLVVHENEFTNLAVNEDLRWYVDMMEKHSEIKMGGILGPDKDDSKHSNSKSMLVMEDGWASP